VKRIHEKIHWLKLTKSKHMTPNVAVVFAVVLIGLLVVTHHEAFVLQRPSRPEMAFREESWRRRPPPAAGQEEPFFVLPTTSARIMRPGLWLATSSLPLENNTAAIDDIDSSSKANGIAIAPAIMITTTTTSQHAARSSKKKKVSVLVNMNARSVTEATVTLAKQVFGNADVYVTRTEADAEAAAPFLVQSDLVVPIGGDGTLTYCLNLMKQALEQQQQEVPNQKNASRQQQLLPDIAYIPLGTGNAVGSVAGCVRNQSRRQSKLRATMQLIQQAAALNSDDDAYTILELPILEVQMTTQTNQTASTLCFFCGAGFDSLMLNDFRILQQWSSRRIPGLLRQWLGSVAGYCVALVTRTLPAAAWRQRHQVYVKITSVSSAAAMAANNNTNSVLWLDHRRGDVAQRIIGDLVYEGQAGIVAASTVPYYGGRLRLFPFARVNTDRMHLRIGRIHPLTGFFNIPGIFSGSFRDMSERFGVLDFLGTDFNVQLRGIEIGEESYPFQHSGESVGEITSFRLKVADQPIRFVSFWDKARKG
jgi:diacylglycerol kinase family enzyme